MKNNKYIILISLIAAMLLFASCSNNSDSGTDSGSSTDGTSTDGTTDHEHIFHGDYYDENGFFKDVKTEDYITIGNYKDIEVPAELLVADEATVQAEIDYILSSYIESRINSDTSYVVKDGDTINIDYVGSIDGVEFEGGTTSGMGTEVTIGVTSYIDDFLEQLIGHNVGENFDIEVTFPADYQATDLAGKDAVFNITINGLVEKVLPELTDEFVSEITNGGFDSEEEMMTEIENSIIDGQKISYLNDELMKISEFKELPESLMAYLEAVVVDEVTHMAMSYGLDTDDFVVALGYEDMDALIAVEQANMEINAQRTLIIQAIATAENITVTEADIDAYFFDADWSEYVVSYGQNYINALVLANLVYDNLG